MEVENYVTEIPLSLVAENRKISTMHKSQGPQGQEPFPASLTCGVQLYLAHFQGQELTASGGDWHHFWKAPWSRKLAVTWAASCLSDPGCQNQQLKAWALEAAKLGLHPSLVSPCPAGHTPVPSSGNWDNNPRGCLLELF